MVFEVCTDSFDLAVLASNYGCKRIELCSALSVGGLTPSVALAKKCVRIEQLETHVMVRPREGDFCYTDHEIIIMQEEIEMFADKKVKGVVFGCLTKSGKIHEEHTLRLVEIAQSHSLEITFHRAFDFVNDPIQSLNTLIQMRVTRLLTSGQKPTAIEGLELIQKFTNHAANRIQIMAGSGVNASNALALAKVKVDALHFTSHRKENTQDYSMGQKSIPDESKLKSITKLFI